jgi:peptidoglycan/xylan/chitin deacetylase (PgdA/CDA1 family)
MFYNKDMAKKGNLREILLTLLSYIFTTRVEKRPRVPFLIDRIATREKVVALTFNLDLTPKMEQMLRMGQVKQWFDPSILETLIRLEVPATFFLTGRWAEAHPAITQTISDHAFFEIGNHGYTHAGFSPLSRTLESEPKAGVETLKEAERILSKYPAYRKLFRFPRHEENPDQGEAIRKYGYALVGGRLADLDTRIKEPLHLAFSVVKAVKPGDVIVLHADGGDHAPATGRALPNIIERLRRKGYRLARVSELLGVG